ncbi:MAG TPA: hypothetical protein VFU21_05135 [Kofleriaceae bacterium]|nr:hypothetical protein [Kofleriaceae bacterium]
MRSRFAVALVVACACGGEGRPAFAPVIEVPPEGSDAYPYAGLDELVLEIAEAGAADGSRESFSIDEPLELTDLEYADDQVVHLTGRTRGVDVAYGRTCAIDITADSVDETPHLYFSRMVKWGAAADPGGIGQAGTVGYSAPDGSAVYVGDGRVSRFDPVSGAFSEVPMDSVAVRADGILAALPDGRAVLIGGTADDNRVPLVQAIDPNVEPVAASRLESQPGPPLVDHAAVTLEDGRVLVAGGDLEGVGVTQAAWLVSFSTANTLDEPEELVNQMGTPRAGHTMTRLGDDAGAAVVIVGGRGPGPDVAPVTTTELYRPPMNEFQAVPGAVLAVPRWNHSAVRMADGSILIIGGFTLDAEMQVAPALPVEVYDPVLGVFKEGRGLLRDEDAVEDMAVVPMPDGRVLLIGGRDASGNAVDTVLIARFDPVDGRVDLSVTDPLERRRAGHSAALLCDGTILVVGGGAGSERYNPPLAGRR